ncbi:MAG: hypothetical protein RIF33_17850 [Cyclobacteriaceae bacterium]
MASILDSTLYQLTNADAFTPRQAVEGVAIFGSIGSGKTSGSGQTLARKYLEAGFGGIILCAKPDELQLWQDYCREAGRSEDLIVLGEGSDESFNFLDYESKRKDQGSLITHNIASVLMTVIRAGEPEGDEKDKAFWDGTMRSLLIHSIELCLITRKELRFKDIAAVINSAPSSQDDLESLNWRSSSACFKLLKFAAEIIKSLPPIPDTERKYRTIRKVEDFFLTTWLNLSEKTRSIVEQMVFNFSGRFLSEPLYSRFCQTTTVTPDDTMRGKIIILNLPYLIYEQAGRDGQILFKYIWQRAVQRRSIVETSRPVFLWADEAHLFLHHHDVDHQSTARAFRACTVYISQNLANYYLHAGAGETGRNRIEALLGNMGTKIFHANSCFTTNEYAANTLGKIRDWSANEGASYGQDFSVNMGRSENVEYIVQPAEFATLKTGGEANDYITEAIVHRQGAPFAVSQTNYIRTYFKQNNTL